MAMKKPRKQSGDKASKIAGKLLNDTADMKAMGHKYYIVTLAELQTLCASVLSQDETKGKRGR